MVECFGGVRGGRAMLCECLAQVSASVIMPLVHVIGRHSHAWQWGWCWCHVVRMCLQPCLRGLACLCHLSNSAAAALQCRLVEIRSVAP